jgi:hypothetical protein
VGSILAKLGSEAIRLADYAPGDVGMGIKSGLTQAFVIDHSTRDRLIAEHSSAQEIIKPFLNGRNVRKYHIETSRQFLIYTPHGIDISRYPSVLRHLLPFRDDLQKRATRQAWYELQQPQLAYVAMIEAPKIIFPDIAIAPRFALDTLGYYGSNTTYFIARNDPYLLGALNSRLAGFYFRAACAGLEGKNETYLRFFGQYLSGFPVRTIDFSSPADVARHDQLVALVERMLALHKDLAAAATPVARNLLQRQIDATDRQIDRLVYALYDLTPEEIAIVEGA